MTDVVDTVRGPISTSGLGVTLMHEHVLALSPEIMANYPEGPRIQRVAERTDLQIVVATGY